MRMSYSSSGSIWGKDRDRVLRTIMSSIRTWLYIWISRIQMTKWYWSLLEDFITTWGMSWWCSLYLAYRKHTDLLQTLKPEGRFQQLYKARPSQRPLSPPPRPTLLRKGRSDLHLIGRRSVGIAARLAMRKLFVSNFILRRPHAYYYKGGRRQRINNQRIW